MKINLSQLGILIIPYLILASLCYTSGYWSNVKIDIFNYYQVQDILKGLANPLFGFVGLTFYPLVTVASIMASWQEKQKENPKSVWPKPDENDSIVTRIALYFFATLFVIIIVGVVLGILILFIGAISAILFPIEDLYAFARIYLSTLTWIDWARAAVMLFLGPIITAWLVKEHIQKPIAKLGGLLGSAIFPLIIAYHFGKMDSYKVLTGLEFRYLETASRPLKYLGKADTYYFFSEDRGYVPYCNGAPTRLTNDRYDQSIRIISADSLKHLELRRYTSLEPAGLGLRGFFERR
jgi:hypothetical protein